MSTPSVTVPMSGLSFEPLDDVRLALGESPVWHDGALWAVDILSRRVLCWRTGQPLRAWALPCEPGCIVPRHVGGMLVARRDGIWTLDDVPTQLAAPQHEPARVRLNDGKADPAGRLWVGGLSDADEAEAAWHCFEPGRVTSHWAGARVANGLAWSPDGRWMYRADSPLRCVWRHTYDTASGAVGPGERWLELSEAEGYPDGAAVDADGCYWLALWEGGALLQVAPDGRRLRRLPLPVSRPTMPCFGGPDLRDLYVSSASLGESTGLDGAMLVTRVAVPGLPAALAAL